MKTTKLFFMAALALMTAACSNDDNDLTTQQPANNMVTITAKLAPKSGSAQTRALSDQTTYIKAEWAQNEQLKIISANGKEATATVNSVDGSGTATISFTIDAAAKGNDCTIIYPASAAVTESAGVYTAQPMTAQTGTLSNDLDVRIGKGTITDEATPQLEVTTQPAAQFAIWKLTLDKTAKDLYITAGGEFLAGATLASAGTVFTVAVPSVSSKTVAVVATDGSSDCWSYSKAGVSLAAGTYYQSSPTMTALDGDNSKPLYKITATSSVTIPDGKTVVLSGVNISSGSITCSGNANIILLGSNTVTTGASGNAAIKIGGSGTTLTITGSGSLTVNGGSQAAAIGTGRAYDASVVGGNIEINGGTITATGGSNAAGIGTGYAYNNGSSSSNTCGTITINGGTVTATGKTGSAGIGTGSAINSNSSVSNECGAITINGGTVNATGIGNGAGIGTGYANNNGGSNKCGAITISTGVTSVTATKGNSSPNSIGKGNAANGGTQTCGTITFGATQVFDGSAWSTDPMAAGTYGGLNLAITNSNKTWTLTPAP